MRDGTQSPAIDGPIILTYTGLYVSPLALEPHLVDIEDIAHALANQCRFSGHTHRFYSVAQHSVLAARLLAEMGYGTTPQLEALLHDGSEYVLQDMARPLKEHAVLGKAYREVEDKAAAVIAGVFGVPYPHSDYVKEVDLRMLATERRDLMPGVTKWAILDGVETARQRIIPWVPERAKEEFLAYYRKLIRLRESDRVGKMSIPRTSEMEGSYS